MQSIGVLSLQGDFHKHLEMLGLLGVNTKAVTEAHQLKEIDGLVLPGGESTTIGMLLERRGMITAIRQAIDTGLPVFGTCAGAILLCDNIIDSSQPRIGGLPTTMQRNAYGSQVDSFEIELEIYLPTMRESCSMTGVFIRAPRFSHLDSSIRVLAECGGNPVMVEYKSLLACTFHPELTNDVLVHKYFTQVLCKRSGKH